MTIRGKIETEEEGQLKTTPKVGKEKKDKNENRTEIFLKKVAFQKVKKIFWK